MGEIDEVKKTSPTKKHCQNGQRQKVEDLLQHFGLCCILWLMQGRAGRERRDLQFITCLAFQACISCAAAGSAGRERGRPEPLNGMREQADKSRGPTQQTHISGPFLYARREDGLNCLKGKSEDVFWLHVTCGGYF